jgi:hypothetical protein
MNCVSTLHRAIEDARITSTVYTGPRAEAVQGFVAEAGGAGGGDGRGARLRAGTGAGGGDSELL